MTSPTAFLRRTPLRRTLEQLGATWRDLPDASVAATISGKLPRRGLTLTDLSPLPRLGFKGRGTVPAMVKRGLTLEARANQAYRQADGSLCLVLAPSEVILLSNLKGDGQRLNELEQVGASRMKSGLIRYCGGTVMPGSWSPAHRRRRCSPKYQA